MNIRIRVTALALGLSALMLGNSAVAQVTIQMTTAASQNCTATTDASGLSLVPNTTVLAATGVNLTGAGCGAGPADFQASLTVPGSTTVGTAVTVQWAAGAQATQCTYGGTAGLTGWPVGGNACSGSACNGPHSASVTPTAALTYDLSITCTNATGYRTGSLLANPIHDPPLPNPFALVVTPPSTTVNSPVAVSWSVAGATSCTGSADLNGSSVTLGGWTDSFATTTPRTFTPTQAGTYSLTLTCSNTFGTATSLPGALVVTGGTGENCPIAPLSRMTSGTMTYPNIPPIQGHPRSRTNLDLTVYKNIWGLATAEVAEVPTEWPGTNGAVPDINNWPKNQYIAAKFTVPAGAVGPTFDRISYSTYDSPTNLTLAVSDVCGDFAPSNANCLTTNVGHGEDFRKMVISPATNGCPLVPGNSYYINIKLTDPLAPGCGTGALCAKISTNNTNR